LSFLLIAATLAMDGWLDLISLQSRHRAPVLA
jgi:hypothetical protein